MTLWFVTPAYRRYDLSAVCFRQRHQVIQQLAAHGVQAQCVVVADDDNLELARGLGFATVERDNRWLGRKFNDGIEYALRNGADWIVPIGSDDWIDPDYFIPLPTAKGRTSHYYAPVESDRLAELSIPTEAGAGPRVIGRELFKTFRPCEERIRRGVDRSLLNALGPVAWEYRDIHPLQYVGFRGDRHITLYAKLRKARGGEELLDPWPLLASHYSQELVDEARRAMAGVRRPLSIGRLDLWGVRDRILLWGGRIWPGAD